MLRLAIALLPLLTLSCGESPRDASPTITPVATAIEQSSGSPASPRPVPDIDLDELHANLGDQLWSLVESSAWFDGDDTGEPGWRLLATLASAGPLVGDDRLAAIIAAYPEGLNAETLDVARLYAQLTIGNLHDVLDRPWLVDGLDAYERAILDIVTERIVSPSALRLSLEEAFFRDIYEDDPTLLSSRMIDALGTLHPTVLARAEQEAWYRDGLDAFDVSLLGVLAEFVRVEDALTVLDERAYSQLMLAETAIAVAFVNGSDEERSAALSLVEAAIPEVEAFAGQFQPLGLLLDFKPIEGYPFCHGDGGSQYGVGYIGFTGPDCISSEVVVHELAHAFLGGRYPVWFSEGAAELVALHVEGTRSGYYGGRGRIEPEGYFFTGSPEYLNQGALGADFLEDMYHLIGEEEMAAALRDVGGQRLSGATILDRLRAVDSVAPTQIDALIAEYFVPAPVDGAAPTPTP